MDARKCLDKSKYENTCEWRKAKRVLATHHVCMEYLTMWRMETNLYSHNLREVKSEMVTLLRNRYSVKQDVLDHVQEISITNQEVPSTFSATPRCYGNVEVSGEELAALSLLPKFAVYSNINIADCEAQVEKGLAKYRWSERNSEAQEDGGDEEPTLNRTSANEFDFRYI